MVKFIFFCMAFIALSFFVVPVFTGISNEREQILAANTPNTNEDQSLSFEEIYEIAAEGTNNPANLNDIAPAAGNGTQDRFSSGFSNREDSALENNERVVIEVTEPISVE